jgi:hypothetical protein
VELRWEAYIGFHEERRVFQHGVEQIQRSFKRRQVVQMVRNLLAHAHTEPSASRSPPLPSLLETHLFSAPSNKIRHQLMQPRITPYTAQRRLPHLASRASSRRSERFGQTSKVQLEFAG